MKGSLRVFSRIWPCFISRLVFIRGIIATGVSLGHGEGRRVRQSKGLYPAGMSWPNTTFVPRHRPIKFLE